MPEEHLRRFLGAVFNSGGWTLRCELNQWDGLVSPFVVAYGHSRFNA
jgi:hypothetical protein